MKVARTAMHCTGSVDPANRRARHRTPVEVNWEWMAKFNHDFKGRAALEKEMQNPTRKLVTLEFNQEDIIDVYAAPFVFGCFIRMRKSDERQPKNILLSTLAAYAWTQFAVVVDEDVDIRKPNDIFWAIQTRCCPERDVMLIPGVSSYTREDVKDENVGKFGIDATAPIDKRHIYKRRTNCMEDKINIEDYYKL